MPQFKKVPVVIHAFQWHGTNGNQLLDWVASMPKSPDTEVSVNFGTSEVLIKTKEGVMRAPAGAWIIQGVNKEYYACQADIFEKTYTPVTEKLEGGDPAAADAIPQGVYVAHCTPQCVQMAKKLYMAYCENSGNKNFRGEECPRWEDLPQAIQSHWCAATIAGLPHLNVR